MSMTGEVAYILAKKYASTQAGKPTKEEIDSSIKDYLDANPVYTGATEEEKAQIDKNAQDLVQAFEQISATEVSISTVQELVTAIEERVSANENSIVDINEELAKHWKELEGHWRAIAKSDKDIVKMDADIQNINTRMGNAEERLNSLNLNEKADISWVQEELDKKSNKGHKHSYNDLTDLPDLDAKADKSWVQEELDKKSNKGHKHTDLIDRITALEERKEVPEDYDELKEQVEFNTNTITEISDVTIPTLAQKSRVEELEALIESLTAEVNDLKKSVSDGKELVAKAITLKGVPTATDSTFEELAINISKIPQGQLTEPQIEELEENLSAEITDAGDLVIEHPTETLDLSFERQEDDLIMEDGTDGLVDARINDKGELEVEY